MAVGPYSRIRGSQVLMIMALSPRIMGIKGIILGTWEVQVCFWEIKSGLPYMTAPNIFWSLGCTSSEQFRKHFFCNQITSLKLGLSTSCLLSQVSEAFGANQASHKIVQQTPCARPRYLLLWYNSGGELLQHLYGVNRHVY